MAWASSVFSLANRAAGSVAAATCSNTGAIDSAGAAPGCPEIDDHRHARPADMPIEIGVGQGDRLAHEQRGVALRALGVVFQPCGRNADRRNATAADDLDVRLNIVRSGHRLLPRGSPSLIRSAQPNASQPDRGSQGVPLHRHGPATTLGARRRAGHAIQGLLRGHGRPAWRDPGRDQARLSQARAQVPPGRQQGTERRGALQGAAGSPRGPEGP